MNAHFSDRRGALRLVQRLWTDDGGASHLEYAIIAFGAGTFMFAGLVTLRGGLEAFYNDAAAILAAILS